MEKAQRDRREMYIFALFHTTSGVVVYLNTLGVLCKMELPEFSNM